MDTLSFIFGIAFVVVIAVAIVAVYAFVKVKQIEKQIEDTHRRIDHETDHLHRSMGENMNEVIRLLDSRCDKLENKLSSTGSKQLIKG